MSSINDENLSTVSNSNATSTARWKMVQYTGGNKYGSTVYHPVNMNVGTTATFTPIIWSTYIDYNTPKIEVASGYTNYATSTWDWNTRQGSFVLHNKGTFKATLYLYNGAQTSYYTSTHTFTITLPVDEGIYFIQNRHHGKYIQVDDNDAPSYINYGGIMEQWPFDGGSYQRWVFTHIGGGYYKITSLISGYAITVPSGKETNDNVDLILTSYIESDNQKWKVNLTSHGSYKIKAKSSENFTTKDLVMDLETNIWIDGLNIRQREYLENTNYKDEWLLYYDNYKYKFLALDEKDVERNRYFKDVTQIINSNLNGDIYQNFYSSIDKDEMKRLLCNSDIFILHSHGCKEGLYISSSSYLSMNDINNLNLNGLRFSLLLTCNTAEDFSKDHINNNSPVNIVEKMVCCGAETVVGFREKTYVSDCNQFAVSFIQETVKNNKTVAEAINDIDYSFYNVNMKDIAEIAGNKNLKLN